MKNSFADKTILITGGTGSFGSSVVERFLIEFPDIKEIRVFSRDEKKQDDMRKKYLNHKLGFYIGDVRDFDSVNMVMHGVDFIFHAAALKQVPSCEFFPMEAFKTNVIGTENILKSAIFHQVKKVICLSTDKAVYPINAMGVSKSMMEKVMTANARTSNLTQINATRYGNVMASRGSVIPLFINQILSNKEISITDPEMTRFMMTLNDAVELVLFAFTQETSGSIFVQKSPAATIETLVLALKEIFNVPNHPIKIIGTRHGEKLYETLLNREEKAVAIEYDNYYSVPPDLRDLNYSQYINVGKTNISGNEEYHSHNTHRLNKAEMIDLLLKLDIVRAKLDGNAHIDDSL